MRSGINLKPGNGANISARMGLEGKPYILIEDRGDTVLIQLNKQQAGRLKDQLSALDLVTGL